MSPLPTSANPKSTLPPQVHFSHLKSIRAHSIYPELNQAHFAHPKSTLSPLSPPQAHSIHPKYTKSSLYSPQANSHHLKSTQSPFSPTRVHLKLTLSILSRTQAYFHCPESTQAYALHPESIPAQFPHP